MSVCVCLGLCECVCVVVLVLCVVVYVRVLYMSCGCVCYGNYVLCMGNVYAMCVHVLVIYPMLCHNKMLCCWLCGVIVCVVC